MGLAKIDEWGSVAHTPHRICHKKKLLINKIRLGLLNRRTLLKSRTLPTAEAELFFAKVTDVLDYRYRLLFKTSFVLIAR